MFGHKKKAKTREIKFEIPESAMSEIIPLIDAYRNKKGSALTERYNVWCAINKAMPGLPDHSKHTSLDVTSPTRFYIKYQEEIK